MYETLKVSAAHLLPDDRFKLGGKMYRIESILTDPQNEAIVVVVFYPITNRHVSHTLLITTNAKFKIYYLRNK